MFKLFYKSLIHIFLWIILLANLFLFFNISSPLNLIGEQQQPNTYFGVSSLIEIFKYLPNTPLGKVTDYLQFVYNSLFNYSAKILNEQWLQSIESLQSAFDSGSGDEVGLRILKLLGGIGQLILSGFTGIASWMIGLVAIVVFIVYAIFFVVNLLSLIIYIISGMFAYRIVDYPSMDIDPYILQVNSVLTSLRACC